MSVPPGTANAVDLALLLGERLLLDAVPVDEGAVPAEDRPRLGQERAPRRLVRVALAVPDIDGVLAVGRLHEAVEQAAVVRELPADALGDEARAVRRVDLVERLEGLLARLRRRLVERRPVEPQDGPLAPAQGLEPLALRPDEIVRRRRSGVTSNSAFRSSVAPAFNSGRTK